MDIRGILKCLLQFLDLLFPLELANDWIISNFSFHITKNNIHFDFIKNFLFSIFTYIFSILCNIILLYNIPTYCITSKALHNTIYTLDICVSTKKDILGKINVLRKTRTVMTELNDQNSFQDMFKLYHMLTSFKNNLLLWSWLELELGSFGTSSGWCGNILCMYGDYNSRHVRDTPSFLIKFGALYVIITSAWIGSNISCALQTTQICQ